MVLKSFNKGDKNMALNSNQIVVGRLATDPDFVFRGKKIVTFKLCNTEVVNGNTNTEEYNIVVSGKQASVCKSYLRKGNLCCIEGKFDGMSRSTIVANRVTFLSKVYRQN
jgi:single-stranded DNA-binding protein